MQALPLRFISYFILFILVVFTAYIARQLLEPVAIAGAFAILFMPIGSWLEGKGINTILAAIICVLIFVIIVGGIAALFYSQFSTVGGSVSGIKDNFSYMIEALKQFIQDTFSISVSKQNKILGPQAPVDGDMSKMLTGVLGPALNILIGAALMLVYMVLLISYRRHIKNFILKCVSDKPRAQKVLAQSVKVVQKYFSGLAVIIVCLWVMYGIGFMMIGLKGYLFFALLCGTLEIIPFVGNITGSTITAVMAFSQSGDITMALEVLATYAVVQSIQFYIIAPFVFGNEININPFFIIFILLTGELVWGIPGMVIAIPSLGIAKIIFDNTESFQPLGYLIGKENSRHGNFLSDRIKALFKRKGPGSD